MNFKIGKKVIHQRLGIGIFEESLNNHSIVNFSNYGMRKIQTRMLKKCDDNFKFELEYLPNLVEKNIKNQLVSIIKQEKYNKKRNYINNTKKMIKLRKKKITLREIGEIFNLSKEGVNKRLKNYRLKNKIK